MGGLTDRSAHGQIIMGSRCAPDLCLVLTAPSSAPHNQLLPIRQVMGDAHYLPQLALPEVSRIRR
jgi:hypothetical protein